MKLKLPPTCLAIFIDETGDEQLRDSFQKVFGLGGCAIMMSRIDHDLREPWREVRRIVAGDPDAHLHATEITHPTAEQLKAISDFFTSRPFARFGAICNRSTALPDEVNPLRAVALALTKRLSEILKWQPFHCIQVIFEHSERLAPDMEALFGGMTIKEDDKPVPFELSWMHKSAGEPGLEVADFLANSIGTEVRHRIAGRPGYAKNFEAFFHHQDKKIVSFMDISNVEKNSRGT
jgi:hypothetical protein